MMDKIRSKWQVVLFVLCLFLVMQLVPTLLLGWVGVTDMSWLLFASFLLCLIMAFALRVVHLRELRQEGFWSVRSLCFSLCALLLFESLAVLSENLDLPDIVGGVLLDVIRSPLGIFTIALLGPLVEECFFRAGIEGHLLRLGAKPWVAIVVSSLFFSLIHGNPAQIPAAFVMGLVLGYAYLRTRSIVLPVIMHVFNNSLSVGLSYVAGLDKASDVYLSDYLGGPLVANVIACVVIVGTLTYLVMEERKKRIRNGKFY